MSLSIQLRRQHRQMTLSFSRRSATKSADQSDGVVCGWLVSVAKRFATPFLALMGPSPTRSSSSSSGSGHATAAREAASHVAADAPSPQNNKQELTMMSAAPTATRIRGELAQPENRPIIDGGLEDDDGFLLSDRAFLTDVRFVFASIFILVFFVLFCGARACV